MIRVFSKEPLSQIGILQNTRLGSFSLSRLSSPALPLNSDTLTRTAAAPAFAFHPDRTSWLHPIHHLAHPIADCSSTCYQIPGGTSPASSHQPCLPGLPDVLAEQKAASLLPWEELHLTGGGERRAPVISKSYRLVANAFELTCFSSTHEC